MNDKMRLRIFVALAVVALVSTGAHFSQAFVNYPAWKHIDIASFPSYHAQVQTGAIFLLLLPRIVEILLGAVSLCFRPSRVAFMPLGVCVAVAVIGLAMTVFVLRPLHVQLGSNGNLPDTLASLRRADTIRQGFEAIRAIIYVYLIGRLVCGGPNSVTAAP